MNLLIQMRFRPIPSGAKRARVLLFFIASFLLLAGAAVACPSCKTADASSGNPAAEAKMTRGWARSIYLLMWTPYLLFGGVTFAIVRSARRKKETGP